MASVAVSTDASALFFGVLFVLTLSHHLRSLITSSLPLLLDGGSGRGLSEDLKSLFSELGNRALRCFAPASHSAATTHGPSKSVPLSLTSHSVSDLLLKSSEFGAILLFAYVCEKHPLHPHSSKYYDRDLFLMLPLLLFAASYYTISRNDKKGDGADHSGGGKAKRELVPGGANAKDGAAAAVASGGNADAEDGTPPKSLPPPTSSSSSSSTTITATANTNANSLHDPNVDSSILGRNQTEEWKGWMQFVFLYYHYYHAEESYNAIRIMITCYVWMTGFGNFSFCYLKDDYSLIRFLHMMWRLNFLVAFLTLTQGNTYILYYICPLHSFYYALVYFTMRVGRKSNYAGKYPLRIKLLFLALGIFLVWDVSSPLFKMLFFWLDSSPTVGATGGTMWEWYFRTSLDHWSTLLGIVFAANYPVTVMWMEKVEGGGHGRAVNVVKVAAGGVLLAAFAWWVSGPYQSEKIEYNMTNSYLGFIPLITYIYFRNLTPTLRSYSCDLLHEIGKTTLETYLMQHHIWLTSNAKTLLTIIPGLPKCNMVVVTAIFIIVSRRMFTITMHLRGILMPVPTSQGAWPKQSFVAVGSLVAAMSCCFIIVIVMRAIFAATDDGGGLSLFFIAVLSLGVGLPLEGYLASKIKAAPSQSSPSPPPSATSMSVRIAVATSSLVALFLILSSTYMSMAVPPPAPLPFACKPYADVGSWTPTTPCNEATISEAYTLDGVKAFSDCNGRDAWGWALKPAYSKRLNAVCAFHYRDPKEALKSLSGRRAVFVGDSVVREVYYATIRQLGGKPPPSDPDAKHEDKDAAVKDVEVDFRWAAYADELVAALEKDEGSNGKDAIFIGGGLWDCLNRGGEIDKYTEQLKKVEEKLNWMKETRGTAIVWLIPTTINNDTLQTPEKKAALTETQVEGYRSVQRDTVDSKDIFDAVISGDVITRDRPFESKDGVHYPDYVYDVAAQIFLQALDWGLPQHRSGVVKAPPAAATNEPGKMANPMLGIFMLFVVSLGLFTYDGYLGFVWVASKALNYLGVMVPNSQDLYYEAFSTLHAKNKLPPVQESDDAGGLRGGVQKLFGGGAQGAGGGATVTATNTRVGGDEDEAESESLIDKNKV